MSEKAPCPKCGSPFTGGDEIQHWECGSSDPAPRRFVHSGFWQSDKCRIRELEAERAKFRWLDASEVTEEGWYVLNQPRYHSGMTHCFCQRDIDEGIHIIQFGGFRFFKLPDDKGTT